MQIFRVQSFLKQYKKWGMEHYRSRRSNINQCEAIYVLVLVSNDWDKRCYRQAWGFLRQYGVAAIFLVYFLWGDNLKASFRDLNFIFLGPPIAWFLIPVIVRRSLERWTISIEHIKWVAGLKTTTNSAYLFSEMYCLFGVYHAYIAQAYV